MTYYHKYDNQNLEFFVFCGEEKMGKKQKLSGIVFLKGKKVILRPLRKSSDLEYTLRWINDPEIRRYLTTFLPISEQKEESWFDEMLESEKNLVFAIEIWDGIFNGVFIGTIGLHQINWKDGIATSGTLIGEKEHWNAGYGTDAKMILLDYAFNTLNLRKICSSVLEFNIRSLRYNLHCGYKIEGRRKKQIFKDGKYWDEIILAVFKKDWLPFWKKYQNQ